MRARPLKSSAGFTYLAAIIIVVILGIMLAATGQSWKMAVQRDKEAELLFRGGQILNAIERWNKGTTPPPSPPPAPVPIKDLKDLVEDPRSLQKVHHLRKVYLDPITNKDFDLIKHPTQGIIGVASSSKERPIRVSFQNMSGAYKTFNDKNKYSDWKFVPMSLRRYLPSETTVTKDGM